MKKIIIVIISSLFLISCSRNDRQIIQLSKVEGYGPFMPSQRFCFENKSDSILFSKVILPKTTVNISLRAFHTQPQQYYYYLYKKGIINAENFSQLISRYNIDTAKLKNDFIDESILIAIGQNDDSTIVCYVDTNNDNQLNDEEPLFFNVYKSSEEEKDAMNKLKPVKVKCENYNGTLISNSYIPLLLNPYKGSLVLSGDWSKQEYLAVSVYEYRTGFIKKGNNKFQIALNNRSISIDYNNQNVKFIYSEISDSIVNEVNADEIEYELADIINIEGNDYKIDSIDFYGEKLFITNLGINENPTGLRIGNSAPHLKGLDINNQYFHLTDLKGKYVLIDFWGTWCAPCISEIPYFQKIKMNFPENKLQIVSVAVDEEKGKVTKFIKEKELDWIHLFQPFDDKSKTTYTNQYKVNSFPTTLLIDMNGKILYKNLRGKELLNTLDKLIK